MNKKHLSGILALLVLVPQVTFAVWWKPGTWFNNWNFHKIAVVQVVEQPDNGSEEKNIETAKTNTNSTKPNQSDTSNKPSINSSGSSVADQTLVYVTKTGIKISYPEEYSYTSILHDKYTLDGCKFDGANSGYKDGKFVDCADYKNPNPKSETIIFGNKDNENRIEIVPSNNKNYKQNHCQAELSNASHSVSQIKGKTVYHITYPKGQDEYCLDTPSYNFELKSDENNQMEIDINKIIFP